MHYRPIPGRHLEEVLQVCPSVEVRCGPADHEDEEECMQDDR